MGKFLTSLLENNKGKIIISIIWGLGLATLFRKVCKGRSCIVIKGPNPEDLNNKVYTHDNKCFKYKYESTICSKDNTEYEI
tara:strand:+ start:723 stop:965 length:243 start_codon:yes stop_codon:yes gene_type:complete